MTMGDDLVKEAIEIGKIVTHPDGRKVKIVAGPFVVPGRGKMWCYQEVFKRGFITKYGDKEHGIL